MPLKAGKSKEVFQKNIEELMAAWERSGKIGKSKPKSRADALRQALAIAYDKKRSHKKHPER